MRAILLASATAASFGGLRFTRATSQGDGWPRPCRTCWIPAVAPPPRQHQGRLLLFGLHRHELHRRPAHRLAQSFGIAPVVLVALDVSLHVLRRHQLHLMAELA